MILAGNGANNKSITYKGIGSILAYDGGTGHGDGDVTINASLVTELLVDDDGDPTGVATFPDNVIGIMAGNNITLGGDSAHLEIMGGFYAQNQVSVAMQTTIMGSIVANEFDTSGNVPDIYQVLPLAEVLQSDSIRMIGSNPLVVLTRVSWRELGVE